MPKKRKRRGETRPRGRQERGPTRIPEVIPGEGAQGMPGPGARRDYWEDPSPPPGPADRLPLPEGPPPTRQRAVQPLTNRRTGEPMDADATAMSAQFGGPGLSMQNAAAAPGQLLPADGPRPIPSDPRTGELDQEAVLAALRRLSAGRR